MTENVNPNPAATEQPTTVPNPQAAVVENPTPTPQTPAPPAKTEQATPYAADTGSKQLDVALGFFVNHLGLSPDSPEVVEAQRTGNFEYLKGHAAQKGIAPELLSPYIALAEGGREELTKGVEARQAELAKELDGYAGGTEQRVATLAFVKANSTDEQLAEFDEILNRGGIGAQALMMLFQSKMRADPNVSTQGKEAVVPNAGAQVPAQATQYPSREAWRAAQRDLINRFGLTGYQATPEGKAHAAAFPG
ncbi:scaffold protein [Xylella phage Paz]|uniref:Scaffold protein n=1 Tax=Xylella phage Paz TaxID=1415145 RepID=V5Q7R0_9CAUD|nr:scaffold protein [Xylella phage Paz]AHB12128.1 scaffold protein [Xylella phage Paz]